MSSTPTVVLVPIIQTALLGVTVIVWLFGFLYTYSVGDLEYQPGKLFGKIYWNDETKWFVAAMIIGGLWLISFNLASNIFVIAAMAATWYFN